MFSSNHSGALCEPCVLSYLGIVQRQLILRTLEDALTATKQQKFFLLSLESLRAKDDYKPNKLSII